MKSTSSAIMSITYLLSGAITQPAEVQANTLDGDDSDSMQHRWC